MKSFSLLLTFTILSFSLLAQNSLVRGKVSNSLNNQAIPFAKIIVIDQQKGAISDDAGNFEITGLNPGVYSFKATASGFKELVINEITVTNARSIELNFALDEIVLEQEEVVVKASPFQRKSESPVSLKTLNATEIERLPGAGRDVSKVIAALPGVASRATFRNCSDKTLRIVQGCLEGVMKNGTGSELKGARLSNPR